MRRIIPLLVAGLLLGGASCSQPVKSSTSEPTAPQVSLAPDDPTPTPGPDIDEAATFIKTVYLDDWDAASAQVADNSVAARFIAHQVAAAQVDDINGSPASTDTDDIDVSSDDKTVTVEDRSGDKPITRVYTDFVFEGDKIASWKVQGVAPLDARLWHKKSSDSDEGVSAELVSAYQTNAKNLLVVVRLTSKRKLILETTTYTPDDGYKHSDGANLVDEMDKGDKTLTYFSFTKAPVGGVLKLKFDTSGYDDLTTLSIKVR